MTVGVVTTSFPRWPGDFAGCFVEDAVRAQLAAGATVEVIAAGADGPVGDDPTLDARVFRVAMPNAAAGVALFYDSGAPETLERGGAATWGQAFFFWAGLCHQIRARARAGAWRRIVAHWLVPSALAARTAAPHLSITAHAHSGDVALLERIPGGRALARLLARDIDDLVFVSDDLRRRFSTLAGCGGRMSTLGRVGPPAPAPAVITTATRQGARTALRLRSPRARTILSVGRLVPIKGFDVLLRAIARADAANGDRPPTSLVILGDGPQRARLEHLARQLNVDLHMPGFVPRESVAQWMAAADLYVQPSLRLSSGRTEGAPTATREALAAGLPVVASDSGGLAELKDVHTVPAGDVLRLAKALGMVRPA